MSVPEVLTGMELITNQSSPRDERRLATSSSPSEPLRKARSAVGSLSSRASTDRPGEATLSSSAILLRDSPGLFLAKSAHTIPMPHSALDPNLQFLVSALNGRTQ